MTTTAGSSPQISTAADAGTYCISVYDVGFVPPTGATLTVNIVHP
jgi:hypothetical protein